jgi:hypothetical protein
VAADRANAAARVARAERREAAEPPLRRATFGQPSSSLGGCSSNSSPL